MCGETNSGPDRGLLQDAVKHKVVSAQRPQPELQALQVLALAPRETSMPLLTTLMVTTMTRKMAKKVTRSLAVLTRKKVARKMAAERIKPIVAATKVSLIYVRFASKVRGHH
jgi:hypothetical protein